MKKKLEYIILERTIWIGGDINNTESGTIGRMTKNVKKYVREMKGKYNKQYEKYSSLLF